MTTNLDPTATPRARSRPPRAPAFVGFANGIVSRLARLGVPIGPNALLTVRGRKSGELRTTPVAIVKMSGRRWVQSPFGDVNWVRNLRAVGTGSLTTGRRQESIRATELRGDEAVAFYTDVLAPYLRRQFLGKLMAGMLGLSDVLEDPKGAASRHPVFELERQDGRG